ncbi:alpha/beta hydrolase [Winogradskyella litoriviva]|uniref:Alpha/beta hydrolase n=1 Tax=Winogradskyella litoriviva TaxID=1220182 RepID=A0ABX2E8D9_9FLAO|nr:alpha/beta hydrolase [Winogradskyella litoriviva]NRD24520.1 alpha/beta hydrolase [Winogradskyella litoriviva]
MKRLGIVLAIILFNTTLFSQNTKKPMKDILSAYNFKTHTISLDSLEISYVTEGNGKKTLLFVHGLSSNSDAWSKNIETLSKDYTCIALDLPGYGKSSKPMADYTPSFFTEALLQFIEKLELKNITLIGHSMGGQASIKFASNYPDMIEKLILVAPAGLEQFSEANATFMKSYFTPESVANTLDVQIEKNYALNFYKQPEDVSKMVNDRKMIKEASDFKAHCQAIVNSISGMLDEPVFNDLESIKSPTLVIFGDKDALIPNRYFNPKLTVENIGEIAAEHIKTVKVEYIKDAGHFVQYEKPQEVNALIEQFVNAE